MPDHRHRSFKSTAETIRESAVWRFVYHQLSIWDRPIWRLSYSLVASFDHA